MNLVGKEELEQQLFFFPKDFGPSRDQYWSIDSVSTFIESKMGKKNRGEGNDDKVAKRSTVHGIKSLAKFEGISMMIRVSNSASTLIVVHAPTTHVKPEEHGYKKRPKNGNQVVEHYMARDMHAE